jgi:hypothetical protein
MRDFQKSKVYKWEQKVCLGKDNDIIPVEQIKVITDYVWNDMNLKYPPLIEANNRMKAVLGTGCRMRLVFPERGASTVTVLHELAHAMSSDIIDGGNNGHGPDFVGIYMRLLSKYAGIDLTLMAYEAKNMGVKFNITATPWDLS